MFLTRLNFKKLLTEMGFEEDLYEQIVNAKNATAEVSMESDDGENYSFKWSVVVHHDNDVVEIQPVVYGKLPPDVTETQIRQIVELARQRIIAYGIHHSSIEKMQYLQKWLHDRLQLNTPSIPKEELATLSRYIGDSRDAQELELSSLSVRFFTGYGTKLHLPPIVLTLAYCWEAEKRLEMSELGMAWHWAKRAQHWASEDNLGGNPNERTQARASKAGRIRSAIHYDWLKSRIAEVLREAPLPWLKNMSKAAKYVVEPEHANMWTHYEAEKGEHAESNKANLVWANFERIVYSWIREDPELRQIIESAKRKK